MNNNEKNNGVFILVLLAIVTALVLLFPKIYSYVETSKLPKIDKTEKNDEVKEVTQEVIDSLHFPLMRNSIYNSNTYYSLDKFSISDMSNSDILLNAFLDIEEVVYGNTRQFNQEYIDFRVKNILGKKVNYTLENFEVPQDSTSNYKGIWTFNSGRFTYNGNASNINTTIKYYNLEELAKAEYDDSDIIVYYYVGFAKVQGNSYVIYEDASMTKEISNGTFTNIDELNNIYKSLNKKKKKIYKYVFKDTLCSYGEYCLYSGEWVNEL